MGGCRFVAVRCPTVMAVYCLFVLSGDRAVYFALT